MSTIIVFVGGSHAMNYIAMNSVPVASHLRGLINTSCHLAEQTPGFVPNRWGTGLKMQPLPFTCSCFCNLVDLFLALLSC